MAGTSKSYHPISALPSLKPRRRKLKLQLLKLLLHTHRSLGWCLQCCHGCRQPTVEETSALTRLIPFMLLSPSAPLLEGCALASKLLGQAG